ncbi:hypothetical protein ACSSS7_002655 [Eimeria intestinalis]
MPTEFRFEDSWDHSHATALGSVTELEEIDQIWTDTRPPLTLTPPLSAANSPLPSVAELEDLDDLESVRALPTPARPFFRRVPPSVVYVSLALLVHLGLLGFRAYRRSGPKVELSPGVPEGKPVKPGQLGPEATRDKVASLRELLPAAEKLAKVVALEEAERLLNAASKQVWEGEKAAASDLVGLEGFIEGANSALSKLHQLACKTAAALAEDTSSSVEKSSEFLKTWEANTSAFTVEEKDGLAPFITTLSASKEHYERVTHHISQVNENIQSQRQFGPWLDKALLLSTANDLEALRSATNEKKYAALITERLRTTALVAARGVFNVKREQLTRWFQQDLELLNGYAVSQSSSSPEASAASEEQTEDLKVDVGKLLQQARSLVSNYRRAAMDLQGVETLEHLIEAGKACVDAERSIQTCFARAWIDIEEAGLKLGNVEGHDSYKNVLQKAATRIMQDHRMVQANHLKFRSTCAHLFPDHDTAEPNAKHFVNRSITENLMKKLDEDLSLSQSLVEDLKKQEKRIAEGEDAAEAAGRATTVAVAMALVRQQVSTNLLRLQMLGFVEEDVRSAQALAVNTASQSSSCSRSSAALVQQLLEKFNFRMKSFKEAVEMKAATNLARELRTGADELSSFLYVVANLNTDAA